jgi:hypothetical protein
MGTARVHNRPGRSLFYKQNSALDPDPARPQTQFRLFGGGA